MAERKISEKSLENLKRFNQENKAITRESIEISLLQLLEKKDFKKITISELVERAGVSRAAFYRNYGSKEEILKSIFESSIAKITKSLDGYNLKTDLYQVWVYLLKEVKKEAKIISLAIDYNFEQVLTKAVYDFLEKRNGSSSNGAGSYLNSFWSCYCLSDFQMGQGWHEDPSGKDCQTRPSPFSTKEEVVTTLLLQLIGGSVCQYMNFVQRM